MTNYDAGRRFEWRVRDELTDDGYETIRAAGSKGKVDLVAFKEWTGGFAQDSWHLLFVQCKRRDPQIPPAERAELVRLARIARAVPLVAYGKHGGQVAFRHLVGTGPKDWLPWQSDPAAHEPQFDGGM